MNPLSFFVFVTFSACDGSTRPTRLRETHERPQERPQDMANNYGGRHERMNEYVTNWGGWLVAYLPDWGGCHIPPPAFLDSLLLRRTLPRPPSLFFPPPLSLLPPPISSSASSNSFSLSSPSTSSSSEAHATLLHCLSMRECRQFLTSVHSGLP